MLYLIDFDTKIIQIGLLEPILWTKTIKNADFGIKMAAILENGHHSEF